jgi:transcriptional regulator with XRE-family HTH domain
MTLQQIFIANLKRFRKERGFSQMALSEKCDTTSNYIGQIEMGRRIPSFEKIEKIAAALQIPPHDLFMYSAERKDEKMNTRDFLRKMPAHVKKDLISRLAAVIKRDISASFNSDH